MILVSVFGTDTAVGSHFDRALFTFDRFNDRQPRLIRKTTRRPTIVDDVVVSVGAQRIVLLSQLSCNLSITFSVVTEQLPAVPFLFHAFQRPSVSPLDEPPYMPAFLSAC